MTSDVSLSNSLGSLIRGVEAADSAVKLVLAVRRLAEARSPEAIPTLIEVLGFNNPGAAVAAVDGLVALGDVAADALLAQIDDYNYTARAWALRALAQLGDPRSLELLVQTAKEDFSLSVRRAAAKGLGSLQWSRLGLDDRLVGQRQALEALTIAAWDPEWVVRYGALAGLEQLGQNAADTSIAQGVQATLTRALGEEADLVVRARIYWGLSKLTPSLP